jgi:hypothetical protein
MTKEKDLPQLSKTERRKKFNDWVDKGMLASQWREGLISELTFTPNKFTETDPRVAKVMSNADRRRLGLEEDAGLPDYQGDKNADK